MLATFDEVVDAVKELPPEQQGMPASLLRGWHIEMRRREIADDAHESLALYRAGRLKSQPATRIIAELRESLEASEDEGDNWSLPPRSGGPSAGW